MSSAFKAAWVDVLRGKHHAEYRIMSERNTEYLCSIKYLVSHDTNWFSLSALGVLCQIENRSYGHAMWIKRGMIEPTVWLGQMSYPSGVMISYSHGLFIPESMAQLRGISLNFQKQVNMLDFDMKQPWPVIAEFIRNSPDA